MNEVLWRTNVDSLPVHEQDFYELALEDPSEDAGAGYIVRRTHFGWDEVNSRMAADENVIEHCRRLAEAEARYAFHRNRLQASGYIYSDMDPIF